MTDGDLKALIRRHKIKLDWPRALLRVGVGAPVPDDATLDLIAENRVAIICTMIEARAGAAIFAQAMRLKLLDPVPV